MTTFRVLGIPQAQPRTRHWAKVVGGRVLSGQYTPEGKVDDWRGDVLREALKVRPADPMVGPVELSLYFLFPRTRRLMVKSVPMWRLGHAVRPDVDNLCKAVMDCLRGIFWRDDTQVAVLHATKAYVAKGERAGVEVMVQEMHGEP